MKYHDSLKCLLFILPIVCAKLFGGGVLLYEVSPQDIRLASAGWAARANDPSTAFTNPAGMARILCPEFLIGIEPIYLNVKFDPNSKTTVEGDHGDASTWVPSGNFYYVQPLCYGLSVGIGGLGYFGSNLTYNNKWVGRYYVTEAFMQGYSGLASLAYQVTDTFSIGAGVTSMYGVFKQEAAVNNVLDGLPDGRLRLTDRKFGWGYILGALYEITPCTRIGIQYLSRLRLNFKDTPDFFDIGPTLDQAITLLGLDSNPVKMKIRVPQMVMGGFYHELNDCWAIMGDIGWQQWSKFGRVDIVLGSVDQVSLSFATKYKDTWHYALGAEYTYSDCLILSFGVAYDTSCVSTKQRTFSFPIGEQWRFGTGVRWTPCCCCDIDFAYELQWTGDLKDDQFRGPLAGRVAGKFKNVYGCFYEVSVKRTF